jgi:excisionase family DNA binding protein
MSTSSRQLTAQEISTARAALDQLSSNNEELQLHISSSHTSVTLPAPAVALLRELLEAMAQGKAVSVLPSDSELSTFELADLLNVSRPHAITLLERGLIPYRMVGTHRRVRLEDALAYKTMQHQRSMDAMAALQGENERLGLQ